MSFFRTQEANSYVYGFWRFWECISVFDPFAINYGEPFRSEHTTALFGIGVPQNIRDGTLDLFFIHVCCEWIPLSRRMGFN